jgi:hypothetical protein
MPRNPLDQAVRFVLLEWCSHIYDHSFPNFHMTFCVWLYAFVCCYFVTSLSITRLFLELQHLYWHFISVFVLFIDALVRKNSSYSNNALKLYVLL